MEQGIPPLSARMRSIVLAAFLVLWVALVPLVLWYADGWRFKKGFGFIQTGGIFVFAPLSDVTIEVDGEPAGTTSYLSRGLYVQDVTPSAYVVRVTKEGYRPWERHVVVEPRIVTEVHAFLVPDDITLTRLTTASSTATTTRQISTEARAAYLAVFATPLVASSTVPIGSEGSMSVFVEEGDIVVRWMTASPPSAAFCGRPSYCVREFALDRSHAVSRAVLYGDGIVYRTRDGSIYYAELDSRPDAVKVKIYSKTKADMSIINGSLFIKDGSTLYTVGNL